MNSTRKYILENDPTKETFRFNGIPVFIEWVKGEIREYPGSPYKNLMHYDYGYIPKTMTNDNMETDVCVYDRKGQSNWVGKLTQLNSKTGQFDEIKYMLGFDTVDKAIDCYKKTMESKMFGGIEILDWDEFFNEVIDQKE